MAPSAREAAPVVVVGAGPAGLLTANVLQRSGVHCVVIERQSREYVERRQRAGIVEPRAVAALREWGLGDAVFSPIPFDGFLEIRVDGESRLVGEHGGLEGPPASLVPQQMLVQKLIAAFLAGGGDLRFDVSDVSLSGLADDRATVRFRAAEGDTHEIAADLVAGCDGDHGVCRAAIPAGELTAYAFDHGIGWLAVLADVPPPARPLFGISPDGFAAQFARGPRASRFYLECPPTDQPDDWPDDRIWPHLRARLGDADLKPGPIVEKEVFPLRSVVYEPMRYGRLYLVGDAAHIISPMGGKGMNLALYDAEAFARAARDFLAGGDDSGLRGYSSLCLRRTWNYQEFSRWMLEMVHDAGDDRLAGPFRGRLARARLDRLTTSDAAARVFAELMAGLA